MKIHEAISHEVFFGDDTKTPDRLIPLLKKVEVLEDLAIWIIEMEETDFKECLAFEEDVETHPFALAYKTIYGEEAFKEYIGTLRIRKDCLRKPTLKELLDPVFSGK